jgi:hypothetical protein
MAWHLALSRVSVELSPNYVAPQAILRDKICLHAYGFIAAAIAIAFVEIARDGHTWLRARLERAHLYARVCI